jgi:hypothetical protein
MFIGLRSPMTGHIRRNCWWGYSRMHFPQKIG